MRWLAQYPLALAFVVLLAPLLGIALVVNGGPAPGWVGFVVLAAGCLSLLHTTRWMRNAGGMRSDTKAWANIAIVASAVLFGLLVGVVLVSGFGPVTAVRT